MAHSNNEAIQAVWNKVSADSVLKIKAIGDEGRLNVEWASVPEGNDVQHLEIGDVVYATGEGQIKEGVELEIKDSQLVNGYVRYYAGGVWNNCEDLRR